MPDSLNLVEDEAIELHNSFTNIDDEKKSLVAMLNNFNEDSFLQVNVIFERLQFNNVSQKVILLILAL